MKRLLDKKFADDYTFTNPVFQDNTFFENEQRTGEKDSSLLKKDILLLFVHFALFYFYFVFQDIPMYLRQGFKGKLFRVHTEKVFGVSVHQKNRISIKNLFDGGPVMHYNHVLFLLYQVREPEFAGGIQQDLVFLRTHHHIFQFWRFQIFELSSLWCLVVVHF